MNLSVASQIAFSLAAGEAQALGNKHVDTEHLFLGLCKIDDILHMEQGAIPDIDEQQWIQAKGDITLFVKTLVDTGVNPKKARRRLRSILNESDMEKGLFSGHRTPRCRSVFDDAKRCCDHDNCHAGMPIGLNHFMLAIHDQQSDSLDMLFAELSIDKDVLVKAMDYGSKSIADDYKTIVKESPEKEPRDVTNEERINLDKPLESETPLLDKIGRDVTQAARDGKIDPAIGRSAEIKKIAQTLIQMKKNNPLLIGEAGVGKTAIVEGFALKVVASDAPQQIKDFRVVEITMSSLVAGTKYRGEFEERLETLLKEASSDPNIVLFIDEIHTMVGAGAAGGAMDAGNILKPALARGTIKCIGATTTAEYRKYIEKDSALERRFQVVWVDEPSKEDAILILKGLKQKYEKHYRTVIPDEVIEKAVELSMRYITDFRLPDKALDILEKACASTDLKTFSPANRDAEKPPLKVEDIARVVSERCRIPVESLTTAEQERLLNIEEHLQKRVIGQQHVIKEIADAIRSSKAGLKDPNKPIVFLFAGSTGTGKTELAKALAEFLFYDENKLLTFDMSEYQEKQTASKLIGSPPGYIGHDEEGQLTGKVRTNPYSVILFDEIEKAHPEVFDIFLQIFDEGRLTDSHGRKASFSESIVILTTNLGSGQGNSRGVAKRALGVNIDEEPSDNNETVVMENSLDRQNSGKGSEKWKEYEGHIQQAISSAFRPEFLNRIQKKLIFYPLGRETVKQIINSKMLSALNKRLGPKGINTELSGSALDFLIEKGYNEAYGAREMQRIFERYITEPLSQMVLKGEVSSGQTIKVSASRGKLHFEATE